jgi:predicted  nucleic acid-binding Zn-ribbon protein
LNADLEALIRLQETHDRIARLTYRIETEIPQHIAEIETELQVVREAVDAARGIIEKASAARARLEQELQLADDKLVKYKAALMQVKTNDEYRAALNEIDYMNRARTELESSILELMEESDGRREQLETLESEFKLEDNKIKADRKVHEDERGKLVTEREGFESAAATIEKSLPKNKLHVFRRIASVRGGVALSRATNGTCGACNISLRPAMFQQVKSNKKMMTCDSCGRILYYKDPAGAGAAGNGSKEAPVLETEKVVAAASGDNSTQESAPVPVPSQGE